MELLKNKIDKISQCSMLFPNTKWIISFDDIQCDTPNSSYDDIEYFDKEFFDDIKDPVKDTVEDVKDTVEDDIRNSVEDVKTQLNKLVDDINNMVERVKNPLADDIKINKIETKDICPLDFFKQTLDLYEDDDIIKNKLFTFISTQKISNKYTKKGISMIMDGITQNKWNIYICKLFSFLLDISFEYRKQNICETNNSKFIIKK